MHQPTGIHHLALSTADMKAQLEFFTQVLGVPLVALFDMHGVEGAYHSFLELDEKTLLSFVQVPGNDAIESTIGVTHAGNGAGASAPGTMQHLAMTASSPEELLAIRDRLRDNGVVVFGPIDHGMCTSIYFAGPEGLTLEASYAPAAIDPRAWVDPAVVEAIGIDPATIDSFTNPPAYNRPAEPVPQPAIDPTKPHMAYPEDHYAVMVTLDDDTITSSGSYPDPPIDITAAETSDAVSSAGQ